MCDKSEFEGQLQYSISIPQLGVVAHNAVEGSDLKDWAILSYINRWTINKKAKTRIIRGKKFYWLKYKQLIKRMPLLHLNSKNAITNRFKKLERLNLIEKHLLEDNTLYVRLTDFSSSIFKYHTDTDETVQPELDRYPSENGQSYPTEDRQPCPAEVGQHNNKTPIKNLGNKSREVEKEKNSKTQHSKDLTIDTKNNGECNYKPSRDLESGSRKSPQVQINSEAIDNPPIYNENSGVGEVSTKGAEALQEFLQNVKVKTKTLPIVKAITTEIIELTDDERKSADALLEGIKQKNKQKLGDKFYTDGDQEDNNNE